MTETQKAQQESALGSAIAASGATLLALVFSATSLAAVAWALVKLVGLPDVALLGPPRARGRSRPLGHGVDRRPGLACRAEADARARC